MSPIANRDQSMGRRQLLRSACSRDGACHLKGPVDNELGRVVDALPGLVWTALPDGQADFLNQRWCEYHRVRI